MNYGIGYLISLFHSQVFIFFIFNLIFSSIFHYFNNKSTNKWKLDFVSSLFFICFGSIFVGFGSLILLSFFSYSFDTNKVVQYLLLLWEHSALILFVSSVSTIINYCFYGLYRLIRFILKEIKKSSI